MSAQDATKSRKNAKERRKKKKEAGGSTAPVKKAKGEVRGDTPVVNLPLDKKIKNFFKGVIAESKRVSWPSKQELIAGTITTIVILFVFAGYLGGADFLLKHLTPKLGL